MRRIILTLLFGCLSCSIIAQEDSLLNKYLIKTLPLKFIGLHPNVGLEIPLSTYHHLDLHLGAFFNFFHFIEGQSSIYLIDHLKGVGINSTIGYKKFSKSWKKKKQLYWGPSMTLRYFRTNYHRFNCAECDGVQQGPLTDGRKVYSSISLELKLGIQNSKRTIEPYYRLGMRYYVLKELIDREYFNGLKMYEKKVDLNRYITPVITVGFYISKPIGK